MKILDNKAYNLELLLRLSKNKYTVPNFIFFSKKDWQLKKSKIIQIIKNKFNQNIIIRSASFDEDALLVNAGKYSSYVIKKDKFSKIKYFVDLVTSEFNNLEDIFIVQEFINNVSFSGVIFTKELNKRKNYYVINYDSSKKTNLITSGIKNPTIKTFYLRKNSKNIPKNFIKLIEICKFLERKLKNDNLDLEFCVKKNKVYILQIRNLPISKIISQVAHPSTITNIKKKIDNILKIKDSLIGNKNYLSNMADWNPVEILGSSPSKLALSLYKELITNDIWSRQRHEYGYSDVRPNVLMYDIYGIPYIDIKVDINSFIPKNLNKNISKKLINFYLSKLDAQPEIHDQVEFKLFPSFIGDFDQELNRIITKIEFNDLKLNVNSIVNKIINDNYIRKEIDKIDFFLKKINDIKNSNQHSINKIFYYNYYLKEYGTLPFAGLARSAFISKYICNKLIDEKIVDKKVIDNFYGSFSTITSKINNDYNDYLNKKISKNNFLKKYGHLRPSTYDISCNSYEENFQKYFNNKEIYNYKKKSFSFKENDYHKIDLYFKKHKLKFNSKKFLKFCKLSTEMREESKFHFTKGIDLIFKELKHLFQEMNIRQDLIKHVDYNLILNAFSKLSPVRLRNTINKTIDESILEQKEASKIIYPDFIKDSTAIDYFYRKNQAGNFYGFNNIVGGLIIYNPDLKQNFSNKIVMIENADPGYDFIFTNNIMGLITKNGGPNSHMAIRCSELNITSIIGIGEENYNFISQKKRIMINPEESIYEII